MQNLWQQDDAEVKQGDWVSEMDRCNSTWGGFGKLGEVHLKQILQIENLSYSSPWSAAELGYVLQDKRALCLGLWSLGELIGYAIGYVEDTDFHLASLAVEPTRRRCGWGGSLLRRALENSRQKGCHWCTLEVRASNRAATQLYQRHGFQPVGVRHCYYTKPVEHALMMRKDLKPSESV